jgi:uncharacterized protein YukE
MAAAEIYLDLEQLKSGTIDLNRKKLTEINRAMTSSCNAVATLVAYGWSGEAKDAFMKKFTEHKQEMKVFYENANEFNKQLNSIHAKGKSVLSQGSRIVNKL